MIGRQVQVDEQARVRDTVAWANTIIGGEASVEGALIGRRQRADACRIGGSRRARRTR